MPGLGVGEWTYVRGKTPKVIRVDISLSPLGLRESGIITTPVVLPFPPVHDRHL